jgi:hypothetical protein
VSDIVEPSVAATASPRKHNYVTAFVSNLAEPRDLCELNLANGHKRLIAHGFQSRAESRPD